MIRIPKGCFECPRCHGIGFILDDAVIGAAMRDKRKDAKISLRELARRVGWSAAYVSDLELGHRIWTPEKKETYRKGLR